MHWPVPLNPNGNHPIIPKLPDGTRDVDHSWDIRDTWKQMEALVKKGVIVKLHVNALLMKEKAKSEASALATVHKSRSSISWQRQKSCLR